MDGLNSAADVTFLLTTDRADLLEPALASRPGRVDLADEETVIERTDGVTASFLKELLRSAALLAGEDDAEDDGAIRVTDAHSAALDQLFESRSQLTRVLLGGEQPTATGDKGTLGARA